MGIDQIISIIMAGFAVLGIIDKMFLKNRLGFGPKFDEGMSTLTITTISITGFICIAPVAGRLLTSVMAPVYRLIGADPSMFAGAILAEDMGGFPLAAQMTSDPQILGLAGCLYASMMGGAVSFNIPVAMGIIGEDDLPYLLRGLVAGVSVIPAACFVGGLVYGIPVGKLLINLLPAIIFSTVIVAALLKAPRGTMKVFSFFAKAIRIVMYVLFAIALWQGLTDIIIIPGMDETGPQLELAGRITMFVAGAYPLSYFITKILNRPLTKLGELTGIDKVAISGIIASLANTIPLFSTVKSMSPRGKSAAIGFSVCGGFICGGVLAYTAANIPDCLVPFIIAKITGAILGAVLGALFTMRDGKKEKAQP